MIEFRTIRERIARASAYFEQQEAVVLTTFNLHGAFLEEQVLPIVLGVEAEAPAARSAELHLRLGETPCTVFYDPTVPPKLSGRYRYVARPVPLCGRLFRLDLPRLSGHLLKRKTGVDDGEGATAIQPGVQVRDREAGA